jgi:hypothetical protein
MGAWFCMGVFGELEDGCVFEALPLSCLRLRYEDEAIRVFSEVFRDCGED